MLIVCFGRSFFFNVFFPRQSIHDCLHRRHHLCLCWTRPQPVALIAPCVTLTSRGIPASAGFPGIPCRILSRAFPFFPFCTCGAACARTHTHTHIKGYLLFIPAQAQRKPAEDHKFVPLRLGRMDHTGSCFLGDHSGSR